MIQASCKIPLNLSGVVDRTSLLGLFVTVISPKLVKYPVKVIYKRTAVSFRTYLPSRALFGVLENTTAAGSGYRLDYKPHELFGC